MIPLKLRLKNFLSYKSTHLDLELIRLACICGSNGAGKSALLDAITWSLWGRSRSGVHHSDIIHSGEKEMEVELEFLSGGQRYRVIRKYAQISPKQARHLLELQISDGQGFRSLSGKTLKETEEKIAKEILRIDYQTFINSVLILQGRADEFTRKDPAERKEVLGKIIGLEFYEELSEKARENFKRSQISREGLSKEIEQLKSEIDKMPQYQKELKRLLDGQKELEQMLLRQENVLSELRDRFQQLELKEHQIKEIEEKIVSLDQEIDYWLKESGEREGEIEENRKLLERSSQIEYGYRLFLEIREKEEELSQKQQSWHKLDKRRRELEDVIEGERGKLERERALLSFQAEKIRGDLAGLAAVEEKLKAVEDEIRKLEQQRESLAIKREWVRQLSAQLQYLEGEGRLLKQKQKDLEEKTHLLKKGVVNCPLCGTELGREGIEHLRRKYNEEQKELSRRLAEIEEGRERLVQEHRNWQEQIEREEGKLERMLSQKHAEKGFLGKEIERIREEGGKIAEIDRRLGEIGDMLKSRGFAKQAWKELGEVEGEIQRLGYDFGHHEEVRRRLSELRSWQAERERLEVARRLLPSLEDALRKAQEKLHEKQSIRQEMESRRVRLLEEIEGLIGVREELGRAEEVYRGLRSRQIENERLLATTQERVRRCQELERDKGRKEEELKRVEEEEVIYRELAEAFGKDGVQALLIEQALPFLEEEANRLIKKLTDNRLGLCFRTQKSTREGKPVETLEIEISDELGTRNYEMYSGGEAFRVDFALRVALARLVAHRAGAPLPILIIDEGFGSQDEDGRERLVATIKAIADEFEKVLVITHMEELKRLFPTAIEVTKTDQGSIARVIT